jgi:hypothetical protein
MSGLRRTRHRPRSLDASSLAALRAGPHTRRTARDRERRELTFRDAVGVHELDVQQERLGIAARKLFVSRMPLEACGGTSGESFRCLLRSPSRRTCHSLGAPTSGSAATRARGAGHWRGEPRKALPRLQKCCSGHLLSGATRWQCQIQRCWLLRRCAARNAFRLNKRPIYPNKPRLSHGLRNSIMSCVIVLTTDIHSCMHAKRRDGHRSLLTAACIRAGLHAQGVFSQAT